MTDFFENSTGSTEPPHNSTPNTTHTQLVGYGAFSILDHLDKLEPAKEKGKYICPVCNGHNLSINRKTGEYDCYNCHDTRGIRKAIAPNTQNGDLPHSNHKPRKPPKSARQREKDAIANTAHIESKVRELLLEIEGDYKTKEQAAIELATWCSEHGYDRFTAGQLLQKELKKLPAQTTAEPPRLAIKYRAIEELLGDRLRFNELRNQIELDGAIVEDPAELRLTLALDHGLSVSMFDCEAIVKRLAKNNAYHPVQEYLEACAGKYGSSTEILKGFAERYFGCSEPIYQTFFIKTLVAAVARIFQPGCKVDTALILQGLQGFNKSTFFATLAGKDWFDDSMGAATTEKDELLKLHQFWLLEWAELEAVFRRKDISAVKGFLSCSTDNVRPPYGRTAITLKRRSIIVGSTNQDEFLTDTTGNRRFWVIPVRKRIDIESLAAERDRIWAAAVALYREGYQWWLNRDEEAIQAEFTESYRTEDPWKAPISRYLKENSRGEVTTADLLTKALELPPGQQNKGHEMRAGEVLKELGWTSERRITSGQRRRVWVEPSEVVPSPSEVVPETETYIPSGLEPDKPPAQPGQPGQPPDFTVVQPEIPVPKGFQPVGTTWTTPNPKTPEKTNGHHPTPEIEPLSDTEYAVLTAGGGQ